MATFPAGYLDLNEKKAFANIATLMDDGTPQVTPVWYDYTDGKVRVNTATGRVKAKTLKDGAHVALSIMDPDNPYRYVQIRGHVTRVTQDGATITWARTIPSGKKAKTGFQLRSRSTRRLRAVEASISESPLHPALRADLFPEGRGL